MRINPFIRTWFITGLAALSLAACSGGGSSSDSGATQTTSSGQVAGPGGLPGPAPLGTTITFMHYNDLHAHLTPHKDLEPTATGGTRVVERGGMARLATLVKRIRVENPNSVLMNIGDTFHGGAEAFFTLGEAILPPMNALGVDIGVPGNWDFGYSSMVFRLRYTEASIASIASDFDLDIVSPPQKYFEEHSIAKVNFPNLAANLTYNQLSPRAGEYVLPPTMMKEIGGVQVGFVGITSDIVHHVYKLLAPMFAFTGDGETPEQAEQSYKALIEKHAADLRAQGAQVVVVMSELGLHKDHSLAQLIAPGTVDVFFSAHTHELTREPLTSKSGSLVVEAGNDGWLGRMDITVRDGKVVDRQWQVLALDRTVPEDADMKTIVDRVRAPFLAKSVNMIDPMPNSIMALTNSLNTVIGKVHAPLDRRHALENNFNNAFTDMMRGYAKTDLAFTPGFRFDSVVAKDALLEDNTVADGTMTLEDAYRFFPMMFALGLGDVDGARLKEIIESSLTEAYSSQAFNHRGGWFSGLSGLALKVDLTKPDGSRVLEMRLKDSGALITDGMIVKVIGWQRPIEPPSMLAGYTGFLNVRPFVRFILTTGEPFSVTDLLIEGISTGALYDAARRDITDVGQVQTWPLTPFVQPVLSD